MTQPDSDIHKSDPYADDELVPFDVQDYSRSRGMWMLGVLLILALIAMFILFKVYQPGVRDRDQAPKIVASDAPDKVVNESAAGDNDNNMDLEIYNAINGERSDKEIKVTESSEEPVKRPGAVDINVTDRAQTLEPVEVTPAPKPIETVPSPTPAPTSTITTQTGDSRHVIQLASLRSRSAAENTWADIQKAHGGELPRGSYMDVVRAEVPNKGTFYRLRLAGLADKTTADRICSRLKSRNQSCFVTTK